jgi:L-aminopeptidase/D-esterase-like protein
MISQPSFSRRSVLRAVSLSTTASLAASGRTASEQGVITDVGKLKVGHFTHHKRLTGCTVLLFEGGAVASVDVRGAAPGTRETDLLQPVSTVERVNAIVLSGGSAFGLDSASGVMRYLEAKGQGYRVGSNVIPIVPAAIIFDLGVGDGKIRPDASAGYEACEAAAKEVPEGNVGAGAGATVGKFFGSEFAMKGGIGTSCVQVGDSGILVGAIVAVNAAGDILDSRSGRILAGALNEDHTRFRDSATHVANGLLLEKKAVHAGGNSSIGVVVTNATMSKTQMAKVAQMAHDGFARSINPVHTSFDGDTIFAAATGTIETKGDVTTIGVAGALAVEQAIRRAVLAAKSIPGYVAHRDLPSSLRGE